MLPPDERRPLPSAPYSRILSATAVFVAAFTIRTWGIRDHLWLLGDQIRDWGIALRPFTQLPLVGPPTHVGGYSLGPAYYWLMWAIRVTIGPWFDNLPHAGGIGQAIVESGADALLMIAIWRRKSVLIALVFTMLVVTAPYDLALSAIVWTSPVSSAFLKMALTILLWNRKACTLAQTIAITALAWCGVQIHTGGIFVATGLFLTLLFEPLIHHDGPTLRRRTLAIGLVVLAMQIPYFAQVTLHRSDDPAMGSVLGGVGQILSGRERPELAKSVQEYAAAVNLVQGSPWQLPWLLPFLLIVNLTLVFRERRDPVLVAAILFPQAAMVVGYAFYLGILDHYTFLSLMPVVVLSALLAIFPSQTTRYGQLAGAMLLLATALIVPARLTQAATWHRMPEYRILVQASRRLAGLGQPMRSIDTAFPLPPSSDATFLYTILGGRLDPRSSWTATIERDGTVAFRNLEGS